MTAVARVGSFAGKLLRIALALLVGLAVALGAVWALAHNDAFTLRVVALLPGVTVTGSQGALLGDFQARRIDIALPRAGRLSLIEPAWQGLRLHLDPFAAWHFGLQADTLRVHRLELVWVPNPVSTPGPAAAPKDIGLPFSVSVGRLQVSQAHSRLWGETPLMDLDAAPVRIQSTGDKLGRARAVHLASIQHVRWQNWVLSGDARLGVDKGVPLSARLHAAMDSAEPPPAPRQAQEDADQPSAGKAIAKPALKPALKPANKDAKPAVPAKLAEALAASGSVDVDIQGSLPNMHVAGSLAWQVPDHPAQSLKVDAEVAPFSPWPLPRLQANAQALNLADLYPALPMTALHGQVLITPQGKHDLVAKLDLRNEVAGAWDDGRLPVRRIQGQASLPGVRDAKDIAQAWRQGVLDLRAQLPSIPGHDDGSVSVQGGWGGQRVVQVDWRELEPQGLHGMAPPLQLQGRLVLKPDWSSLMAHRADAEQAGATKPDATPPDAARPSLKQRMAATASAVSGDGASSKGLLDTLHAVIQLEAKGVYGASHARGRAVGASGTAALKQAGPARPAKPAKPTKPAKGPLLPKTDVPVSVKLDGRYAPGRFELPSLILQALDEQAELSGGVLTWGAAPQPAWTVKGHLKVQSFDPQVWLPWPEKVTGRSQLTGEADIAMDARWRGQFDLRLAPSTLAGVPVAGQAQWRSPMGQREMALMLDLQAAGNTVQATAALPWHETPTGGMRLDQQAHWQGTVHAPALNKLQAVAPLLGASQVAGNIEASFKGEGVWPALRTDGQLTVGKLQWVGLKGQTLGVGSAQARWAVQGLTPDAPLRLQLDVAQGQIAQIQLDKATWSIDGSLRAHQSSLSADFTHKPKSEGKPTSFHVGAALKAGWQAQEATWQAHVSELLATMAGGAAASKAPRTLLQAQPFDLSWHDGADGRSAQVSATVVNVLGASLRVRKALWQSLAAKQGQAQAEQTEQTDNAGEVDVALVLDPLNLPAVLASWQPQAGWGGDLLVVGALNLRHSLRQPWQVDAHIARQSGDLSLSEPTILGDSAQRLGIRDARIALQAQGGVWTLTEQFDGRVLGLLKGRQTVRAASPDQLPAADDALSGELDLQIANMRPWGTWVPAGWRLTGQMQAKAEIAGTLGAPQYRGQVSGQNLGLGQALMGVNITDGQLEMALAGERIELTKLTAQGGPQGGQISAQGVAMLGAQPHAELSIKAERFALLQRVDRRVVISGDAQAVLGEEEIKVDGRVQIDEGLIDITRSDAPVIGDDVNVVNKPGQDPQEEADAGSSTGATPNKRKLNANVSVDMGHQLRLKGRGLDAILAGKLRLTTPGNRPTLTGTVQVENGTFAAYGQKLVIERGAIAFTGPIENPRLDILAMRPQSPTAQTDDVKVGVNITGTAQDPRIRLYSDPALSETETLSWLVLGRAPTGLGGADIGLLQSAAVALLSGENSSPSDSLVSRLGLDELSVRQSESAGAVRDTVVNLGKQVSKYWYVGYERNLNATSGNWQLIYKLAQRFTVRAQAGDDNAVDFIWTWKWD